MTPTYTRQRDPDSNRWVVVIRPDRTLDQYACHLIENGHKRGVLQGRDVPDSEAHLYQTRRRSTIQYMERRWKIKPQGCQDVPFCFTWSLLGVPVRVIFADRGTAEKAANELFEALKQLRRGDLRGEALTEAWEAAERHLRTVNWYFAAQGKNP